MSYARGDDPDNWQPPDINVPLTLGDRLYTDRGGRAELQIQGGTVVRLDATTDLAAANLTEDTKQISQNLGSASYQVRRLGAEEVFEVDTPNAAVTFDAPGDYRVDVDNDGNSRIRVRAGRVIVASGGGQVTLSAGDEMDIDGIDRPRVRHRRARRGGCLRPMGLPAPEPLDARAVPAVREPGHRRDRGSRRVRPLAGHSAVRAGLVADRRRCRLGPLPRRPLDLAGPLGLDLGVERVMGMGAVSLRALGHGVFAVVLGAGRPAGAGLVRAGPRRVCRRRPRLRRQRFRRMVFLSGPEIRSIPGGDAAPRRRASRT